MTTASPPPDSAATEYVWLQRVTNWPLAIACGAGALATLAKREQSTTGTVLAVASLLIGGTALSTVRVIVDATGLTVGLGPWGWPDHHIPMSRIRAARVEKTSPLLYGGWGLRWRPGRVRIIIRRVPGLVVDRADGTSFGVTTPDAAEAARLLTAQLAAA